VFTALYSALILGLVYTTSAQTAYTWTGDAGEGSNWYDATNWVDGNVPTNASLQLATSNAADTVTFDSETASSMPGTIDTYQSWTINIKMPQVIVLNGTVSFDGIYNYGWSGINTFTIGDGDIGTLAQVNIGWSILNWYPNGIKTYVINSDGTLNVTTGITGFSVDGNKKKTVIRLVGGSVNIDGSIANHLTNAVDNYVSFELPGSSFTASLGGQLPDLATVEANIGSNMSFRIADVGLDSDVYLDAVENAGNFTITLVDPPPSGTVIILR
jgi:hypothetical protein